jgi:hypothetical protein
MFYFMIALKAVDILYGFGYHVSAVVFRLKQMLIMSFAAVR